MTRTSAATVISVVSMASIAAAQQPADLIVTNARIYTVDATRPLAEAMVVREGRIVFVGGTRAATP